MPTLVLLLCDLVAQRQHRFLKRRDGGARLSRVDKRCLLEYSVPL